MKRAGNNRGVLTIEASISYSIFLMVIVTMLYVMRIVYVYGLMQHAVSQTAKELSMYTYIYQVAGINDLRGEIASGTAGRTDQFNKDAGEVVQFYESFSSGDLTASYNGTTSPVEILKNVGGALLGEAGKEANQQLFALVVRPLMEGYIGADAQGNSADARLKALRVKDGVNGINLDSSSFFEDGETIDLVACYTIDPVFPIDIIPEMNLVNRASIRGASGESIFTGSSQENEQMEEETKEDSVWDKSPLERGKAIQDQEKVRNLPDKFPTFSAFDSTTGRAVAERSIDLRDVSYQDVSKIKNVINGKCKAIQGYETKTYGGITLDQADIKSRELILYIPSSRDGREIDRSKYDQAVREMQARYPDIIITTREID